MIMLSSLYLFICSFQIHKYFFHNINQDLWESFNKVLNDGAIKDPITSANSSHFLFCGIFLQLLNFCLNISPIL